MLLFFHQDPDELSDEKWVTYKKRLDWLADKNLLGPAKRVA
jgi:hypothetical protein